MTRRRPGVLQLSLYRNEFSCNATESSKRERLFMNFFLATKELRTRYRLRIFLPVLVRQRQRDDAVVVTAVGGAVGDLAAGRHPMRADTILLPLHRNGEPLDQLYLAVVRELERRDARAHTDEVIANRIARAPGWDTGGTVGAVRTP